jgi:hypothetical protein
VEKMNPIDKLLLELDNVKELMKSDAKIIESSIPYLIGLLDIFQSNHLGEAASFVTDCLLSLGYKIIPYLKLSSQDTSFIHYFSYYVIPKCSDELLVLMKHELLKVVKSNYITEESDLNMIQVLLDRKMFIKELNEIVIEKRSLAIEMSEKEEVANQRFFLDYLAHLDDLVKDLP